LLLTQREQDTSSTPDETWKRYERSYTEKQQKLVEGGRGVIEQEKRKGVGSRFQTMKTTVIILRAPNKTLARVIFAVYNTDGRFAPPWMTLDGGYSYG